MKKTTLFSLLGVLIIMVALTMGGCKKKNDEEHHPYSYSPSFVVIGEMYTSEGYTYFAFEFNCTSDAVEITEIMVVGPNGTETYSYGGEIYGQDIPFYLYDADGIIFLYNEGTFTFTIRGFIRSGSYSGDSFNESISWGVITPCPGTPHVTWQNQTYNTVQIKDQCWMRENLNYAIGNSWCYNNDPANCSTYGRLYDWQTVMNGASSSNYVPSGVQGICPTGWHIPSDAEWKILEGSADSQYGVGNPIWDVEGWRGFDAGLNLKSTVGWNNSGNGTNKTGFTALPSGFRGRSGNFLDLGNHTHFRTSTEYTAWPGALRRTLSYDKNGVDRYVDYLERGHSLRCLKD